MDDENLLDILSNVTENLTNLRYAIEHHLLEIKPQIETIERCLEPYMKKEDPKMSKCVQFGPVLTYREEKLTDRTRICSDILRSGSHIYEKMLEYEKAERTHDLEGGAYEGTVEAEKKGELLDECCEMIQHISNLCASVTERDMTEYMMDCRKRHIWQDDID